MWATCNHQTHFLEIAAASCERGVLPFCLSVVLCYFCLSHYISFCVSLCSLRYSPGAGPGLAGLSALRAETEWRQLLSGRDWDHRAGQTRPGGNHSQSGGTNTQNTSQTKQSFSELNRLNTGRLSNLDMWHSSAGRIGKYVEIFLWFTHFHHFFILV